MTDARRAVSFRLEVMKGKRKMKSIASMEVLLILPEKDGESPTIMVTPGPEEAVSVQRVQQLLVPAPKIGFVR